MPQRIESKVNLKTVADRVGLAPCSVSAVLNDTPASRTIPQATKDRIIRAADELKYRPNFWARSLRTKRTHILGVVAQDFGDPAVAKVVAAAQDKLHQRGYLLALVKTSGADAADIKIHLRQRGIEGLIAIEAIVSNQLDMPVAAVDLSFLRSTDMIANGIERWLKELGASAADSVIDEIEGKKPPKRATHLMRTVIPNFQVTDTTAHG